MALRDDLGVRHELHLLKESTPKSRVSPRSTMIGPPRSQETGKSSAAPYFSPGMLRRTNILIPETRLKLHFLPEYRIEPTTNERAPETPCRLAYFATRVPCSREQAGGAERAEGARSQAKKIMV